MYVGAIVLVAFPEFSRSLYGNTVRSLWSYLSPDDAFPSGRIVIGNLPLPYKFIQKGSGEDKRRRGKRVKKNELVTDGGTMARRRFVIRGQWNNETIRRHCWGWKM